AARPQPRGARRENPKKPADNGRFARKSSQQPTADNVWPTAWRQRKIVNLGRSPGPVLSRDFVTSGPERLTNIALRNSAINMDRLNGLGPEQRRAIQFETVQPVFPYCPEGAQPIFQAPLEIDATGLREVANRHRDVAQPEAETDGLDQEFGVKNEIVGVA